MNSYEEILKRKYEEKYGPGTFRSSILKQCFIDLLIESSEEYVKEVNKNDSTK